MTAQPNETRPPGTDSRWAHDLFHDDNLKRAAPRTALGGLHHTPSSRCAQVSRHREGGENVCMPT